jgi:DNA-binding FrmR family transcriptional regulator
MKRTATQPTSATQEPDHVLCACTLDGSGRKAVAVDPEIKRSNIQVCAGLRARFGACKKMIEEERYCADIIIQISSVQEALRSVGRALSAIIFNTALPRQSGAETSSRLPRNTKNSWN